jgi:nucleolar protein 9
LTSTTSPTSLFSITERIATTLTSSEPLLRDSFSGRIVWRNWSLDIFKRRRGEWVNLVKSHSVSTFLVPPQQQNSAPVAADEDEAVVKQGGKKSKDRKSKGKPGAGKDGKPTAQESGKSAIQLAREKFAAKKAEKMAGTGGKSSFKNAKGRGTGANAV